MEVTFTAGVTTATVRVQIRDDSQIENEKRFTAVLSGSGPGTVIVNNTAIVTILDLDGKLFITIQLLFTLSIFRVSFTG